nr:MAG TPA: hypothetical protein [Caudoviricetes sp.]
MVSGRSVGVWRGAVPRRTRRRFAAGLAGQGAGKCTSGKIAAPQP